MNDDPRMDEHDEIAAMIRAVEVRAPDRLHEQISEMVERRGRAGAARRMPAGLRLRLGAAITATAAGTAAIVLALTGGSGGAALSLAEASAVTLRPATMAAPVESPSDGSVLNAAVEGVSFPYWNERFGWRSTGSRTDRVDGRTFRTVFYGDGNGHTIGYAIVSGGAPSLSGAGSVRWRAGTAYRLGRSGGAEVVTWQRDGHLCIVSGRGVGGATLLALASWNDRGGSA